MARADQSNTSLLHSQAGVRELRGPGGSDLLQRGQTDGSERGEVSEGAPVHLGKRHSSVIMYRSFSKN